MIGKKSGKSILIVVKQGGYLLAHGGKLMVLRAKGERGEGCTTAAVAELKATGSQSITDLLPGLRLNQLGDTCIAIATSGGLMQPPWARQQ